MDVNGTPFYGAVLVVLAGIQGQPSIKVATCISDLFDAYEYDFCDLSVFVV